MTASQAAKQAGFKSLAELSQLSGESTQNLNNWFNDRPLRFKVILLGCVALKHKSAINKILEGK